MSKHYHVISGLQGGYIPNRNDMFATKAAALDSAMELVNDYRDNDEAVIGSRKDGLWQMRRMSVGGFADYVEVSGPCFDECEEWED